MHTVDHPGKRIANSACMPSMRRAVVSAPRWKQALSVVLSVSLTIGGVGLNGCKKEQPKSQQTQTPAATYAVPTPDQLYQLVAPIALFPDNLLAQVLAASAPKSAIGNTLLTSLGPRKRGAFLFFRLLCSHRRYLHQ